MSARIAVRTVFMASSYSRMRSAPRALMCVPSMTRSHNVFACVSNSSAGVSTDLGANTSIS